MAKIGFAALAGLGGILLTLSMTAGATAQQAMGNQPWNFTPQNRAGIAALIQQGGTGGSGAGSGSAFACGGGGEATATANYTCIIINDSEGSIIHTGQDSDGDQTATTDTETSVNGVPDEDLSEVLETLSN
jgi:hypothetical protein